MAGKPRVLVTRPEPGASEIAGRLEAMGFLALKLPLQEIRPLKVDADVLPADIAAVVTTSANAIRHAPKGMIEKLNKLPCFAVGASTVAVAADAGFADVTEGGGDAEALAQTMLGQPPRGPIVYLCGKVRRPALEQLLASEGIVVHVVETYDTIGLDCTVEEVINLTAGHPIDYALVYSANAAEALLALMRQTGLEGVFGNTIFACISRRVAETLGGWPRGRVRIAAEPDERMLLSLLGPDAAP